MDADEPAAPPMADYIYLMQNRLSAPQWRALEAVREAARTQGMPVFLVGGAVRDLTTGTPVRDLDFALQGDVRILLEELQSRGGSTAGEHASLGSVYLTFPGGVRVEVGPTVSVSYPKPGKPEVQTASILDDLRRRDFTANAMAVSLNEGSYGLLLDPLNGIADLENHELRLSSAYGFIEQPALLLRATRLSERLGWSLEERTSTRYQTSKEEGHIEALPEADKVYELQEIFHEEDPVAVMTHLEAEGWLAVLAPFLKPGDADRSGLDSVSELLGRMESRGLHPDPSAVNFPLATAKMTEANRNALKGMFARAGFARQIDSMEARAKELAGQLTAKTASAPSDVWHLLMNADAEVVLALAYTSRSSAVQGKIKAFLNEWPQMRQKIPYAILQEMRITPDLPGYDKLLDDIFFALIDGKLGSDDAIRAFLEPYSPPAPPQVQVRRRPAKATRSRASKKAAAGPAATLSSDEEGSAGEDDAAGTDSDDADTVTDSDKASEPAPPPAAAQKKAAKKTEAKPVAAAPAPAKAAKTVAPPAPTPKPVPAKEEAEGPRAKTGSGEAAKGKAVSKPSEPAKPVAGKETKPKVEVVPAKKVAAKVVAVKTSAAPVKAPAKKTVAAKSQPAPAKAKKAVAAPGKAAPAKTTAKAAGVKTPAKKAPAKKTVPAKKGARR